MKKYSFLLLSLIISFNQVIGQIDTSNGRDGSEHCIFSNQNGFIDSLSISVDTNGWISFMPLGILEQGDLFNLYKSELGLSSDDEMRLVSSQIGENEDEHYKYKQFYKGIPVECGTLIEHFRSCLLVTLNGKYLCDLDLDVSPTLSEQDAIQVALDNLGPREYMWTDSLEEEELKIDSEDPNATYYPNPKLVIDCGRNLVYLLKLTALDTIVEYRIDAKNGSIVSAISPVLNCSGGEGEHTNCSHEHGSTEHSIKLPQAVLPFLTDFTTFGNTLFSGIQSIRTTWSASCLLCSSKHRLIANNYSSKIETRDNEGTTGLADWRREVTMSGINNTTWPMSDVRHTQTHWAVTKSYDYFKEVHGNYIGAGNGTIRAKSNSGISFAAYLGDNRSLIFGVRSGFYLGVMDAAGHEFTHLVVDEKSDLGSGQIGNTESRSLNESFADIFGTMVEREYRPGGWDWIFEDEAVPLRDVKDPRFSPTGAQPETYRGPFWNFATGQGSSPHRNGGVQNKWFSLLALGGIHNGIQVQGIGIDKAADITWHNLLNYIESNSAYIDSRNGAVQSAIDLFGDCSFEHKQTELAWQACGLGTASNCFTQTGNPTLCVDKKNLPLSITIDNSFGVNLTWMPLDFKLFGLTRQPSNWTFNTSGPNNNILTITDIPDNESLGGFYLFMYSDGMGGVGVVNFKIVECPGITTPDPNEEIDYCANSFNRSSGNKTVKTSKLIVSPNPVLNILEINSINSDVNFTIYDISGTKVLSGNTEGLIDVSSISAGSYIITIIDEGNKNIKYIKYGKFIKID